MRTDIIVIRDNRMSMQRFCDLLLEEAKNIPDDKTFNTEIVAEINLDGEVEVYLEY